MGSGPLYFLTLIPYLNSLSCINFSFNSVVFRTSDGVITALNVMDLNQMLKAKGLTKSVHIPQIVSKIY